MNIIKNKKDVLISVKKDSLSLKFSNEELKNDKKVILAEVQQNEL